MQNPLRTFVVVLLALGGGVACSDSNPPNPPVDTPTRANDGVEGSDVSDAGKRPVSTTTAPEPDAQVTPAVGSVKAGRISLGATPLPCALRRVLSTNCQSCHARDPGLQAPMALTSLEDWEAASVSQPERKVYELAMQRVHEDSAPMPPAGRRRLESDALAVVDEAGRPDLEAGPERCEGPPQTEMPVIPLPSDDEIDKCYRLKVHQVSQPGDETPYVVPAGESHVCFVFAPPWGERTDVQALSIRSHNGPLVHHWVLSDMRDVADGQVLADDPFCWVGAEKQYAAFGINQQSEVNMPEGVGLKMPSSSDGVSLMLNVHYNNRGDAANDDTYLDICTAKTPRPAEAEVVQLRTGYFVLQPHQPTSVSGTCTVTGKVDAHIVRSFPHMHARGRALDTIIQRADGTRETLINMPFDMGDQLAYDTPAIVHPGDKLLTTCHWQNDTDETIVMGEGVDNEMCINFVTVWPVNALINGKSLAGVDGCLR